MAVETVLSLLHGDTVLGPLTPEGQFPSGTIMGSCSNQTVSVYGRSLQTQLVALQQYTKSLQEDFDCNLSLLDEQDAALQTCEREKGILQQSIKNLQRNEQALRQRLAVSEQGG